MEYVLLDIKNFLQKLEDGQLEIEAGQWELHKALISMHKTMSELSNLKDDVADMKRSNMHQMGIIKELQVRMNQINQNGEQDEPVTVSESSVEYKGVFKRPKDGQGFKKRKCHIRSEEIIEITSQMSDENSESGVGQAVSRTQQQSVVETTVFKANENDKNSDEESGHVIYKKESYIIPAQNKPDCHYPTHTSNDILQRYLKDSAKYLENKISEASQASFHDSKSKHQERGNSENEYTPFWDEYSSRAPPESNRDDKSSSSKENSTGNKINENSCQKKFVCPGCPKKFLSKVDFILHKKKHQVPNEVLHCNACGKGFKSKQKLREHKITHKLSSKAFKGFRCCYCTKVCPTPEKLTEHLRKCRTIMKPSNKSK